MVTKESSHFRVGSLRRYDIPFAISVLFLLFSALALQSEHDIVFRLGITLLVAGGGLMILIATELRNDRKEQKGDYKLRELAKMGETLKKKEDK